MVVVGVRAGSEGIKRALEWCSHVIRMKGGNKGGWKGGNEDGCQKETKSRFSSSRQAATGTATAAYWLYWLRS
jgi:hypothetical protein